MNGFTKIVKLYHITEKSFDEISKIGGVKKFEKNNLEDKMIQNIYEAN